METDKLAERFRFVMDYETGQWTMTELCERFGITRPTGYKWIHRARSETGLEDLSRAPRSVPHRTAAAVEEEIVALRRKYGWGAKKVLDILTARDSKRRWPARSTVNEILERHGLLRKNRRRKKWTHPGVAPLETERPNQVWPADFKGQFKTRDGVYCYPLTVTDHYSRSLLVCRGLGSVKRLESKPVFRRLFRECGLPEAIRTDNGPPFASQGIHGLTWLSVWWMQLGIVHQRIRPASPQENGQHERMHRELKRETTRPAASSRRSQQKRFDEFQRRYNEERPHDGIGGRTPSSLWAPSPREYTDRLRPPEYPSHMEKRRVSNAGCFRFGGQQFLSVALKGQYIGLEEVAEGIWNIVYYSTLLGRIDARTLEITGV